MDLQHKFIQHLKKFPAIQQNQQQLLAVSGGVDSMVLCDLMCAAGYDFVIAHCNFQLRGEESERDELFVKSAGEKYGKQVLIQQFETEKYAAVNKKSIQLAARELRYDWFRQVLNGQPTTDSVSIIHNSPMHIQNIVTAHHANDNIETLLINFFKGTGITGLHGIAPLQDKIFRPLLFTKKEELLAYATERKLEFVEDSSNLSDKYTRNFFRHRIVPTLKEVFPEVENNLLKNIERFTETEQLYRQAVDLHKKKLLEIKGNEVRIPVLKLQKTRPLATILYEIIKDFGFTSQQTQEAIHLLTSETGKYISSPSHRVIRNRNWLIISPLQTSEAASILIENGNDTVVFAAGKLHLKAFERTLSFQIPPDTVTAAVDCRAVTFPLLLRRWRQGDYFYPLGMKKKKKLSRFFIDQKLSKTAKENIWVLEMNKKIVWIVGHRIDDRFKILPATQQILAIHWQS